MRSIMRPARLGRPLSLVFAAMLATVSGIAVAQSTGAPIDYRDAKVRNAVWTSLKDYTFLANSDAIIVSDLSKAREISEYLRVNPTFLVGLDGWNARRVTAVKDALLHAGVPDEKILTGAFGYWQMRRDGLVMVMVAK